MIFRATHSRRRIAGSSFQGVSLGGQFPPPLEEETKDSSIFQRCVDDPSVLILERSSFRVERRSGKFQGGGKGRKEKGDYCKCIKGRWAIAELVRSKSQYELLLSSGMQSCTGAKVLPMSQAA